MMRVNDSREKAATQPRYMLIQAVADLNRQFEIGACDESIQDAAKEVACIALRIATETKL